MELWNEICFLVNQHRKPNSTERDFQIEAEHLFEKLGWSRFKGEIITQHAIPIGSAQSLKPDIIIAQDHKRIIVAELKKPNADIVLRNGDQLISYMLQLRLRFGLLIGDTFRVFYDTPDDNENPIQVIEIPFSPDNVDGAELINVLKKDAYSDERFASWCVRKIEENAKSMKAARLVELLTSKDGNTLFLEVLRNHLKTLYSDDVVAKVLEDVLIRVEFNNQKSTDKINRIAYKSSHDFNEIGRKEGAALNIELRPASSSEFKKLLLQKKHAIIVTYYNDGRVEKRKWDASRFTESSNVIGNLRSRPEFRNGEWQKKGITKVVSEIDD